MKGRLEGKRIAILVEEGFEEEELTEPRKALEKEGAKTYIVSPQKGSVHSWDHDDWGGKYKVDYTLDEVRADQCDALLLPGGVMSPDKLRRNEKALRFVRGFFEANKPVAAICHGPWTLIDAGVVQDRKITSYHSLQSDLRNAGANWVDEEVVVDQNLVTSREPGDIPAFNEKMVELFAHTPTQHV